MGHREDVWENPMYQGLLLGALGWATGRVEANVEPNIRTVTPKYDELPASERHGHSIQLRRKLASARRRRSLHRGPSQRPGPKESLPA